MQNPLNLEGKISEEIKSLLEAEVSALSEDIKANISKQSTSRLLISILPDNPEEKQIYVIKMVLEQIPCLPFKCGYEYCDYFDFPRTYPLCNKEHM